MNAKPKKTAAAVKMLGTTVLQRERMERCDHFPLNAYTGDALWFTCPDCGQRFMVLNAAPDPKP